MRNETDEINTYLRATCVGNNGDDYWPLIMRRPRMLNAGVDVNNFEPVTFDELLANNQSFLRHHADTAKANPFDLYCAEA